MKSKKISVFKIITFIVLALYVFSMFLPMFWGVITSLKTPDDYYDNIIGFPRTFVISNYLEIIFNFFAISEGPYSLQRQIYIEEMLLNSLTYSVVCAFLSSLVTMITAYVTAKFDFKFSGVIYFIVVVTMILPIVGAYPSMLTLLQSLNLYDKIYGTWIMSMNFTSMYYLVFYSTFKGVAKEYTEAAYVDGAGELNIMVRVVFPIVRKIFFTVFLITAINYWNDYQAPALYIPSYPTLAYGVYYVCIRDARGLFTYTPGQMAVSLTIALPIIILFIIFKDKLMGNLTMGGIKG